MSNRPISTIITINPVVANTSTKFSQILRLFTEFPVHHLPVMDDDNKLIGIVSTNDLPKVFLSLFNNGKTPGSLAETDELVKITDIMTSNPVTITSTDTIAKAAGIFADKKFLALPVVDNGVLVGILSMKDIVTNTNF